MEDLWSPIHKKKSIDFFKGEGFRLAAEMSAVDKLRLLLILRRWEKKVIKVNNIRHSHAQ